MKRIFIPSIPHTGTWFTVRLLLGHSQVGSLTHLYQYPNINPGIGETGGDINILHTHYGKDGVYDKWVNRKTVELLVDIFPTVIPVRDPLAVIISRSMRHRSPHYIDVINSFVYMAKVLSNKKIFFLPVDLMQGWDLDSRLKTLGFMFHFLCLKVEPYIEDWVSNWSVINTKGQYSLKKLYQDGDYSELKIKFPLECQLLENNVDSLVPFMESLGYDSANLMWAKGTKYTTSVTNGQTLTNSHIN